MTGPVHIEFEIVAATVDASGTVVVRVDAVADPLGLNPILRDLGLAVDYFRLIRVLARYDVAAAVDWMSTEVANTRRDRAAAVDQVGVGVRFAGDDRVASFDAISLAFVQRSIAASQDWTRQRVNAVRIDASVAVDVLALAVARYRRDTVASHDSGQVVLENYALDYADDYVGDATSF
ncbi:hypothetical protein ABE485_12255 [Achromobacter spanius]|uniref:hypothetical protein n=1 Tax=Achromobacter spanius TaxID=217203 RepID=UPI00320B3E83